MDDLPYDVPTVRNYATSDEQKLKTATKKPHNWKRSNTMKQGPIEQKLEILLKVDRWFATFRTRRRVSKDRKMIVSEYMCC